VARAKKPKRPRSSALPAMVRAVVAVVVLLLAAALSLLFAMRFTAIAFDCGFSPFKWLPHVSGSGDRVLILAGFIAFLTGAAVSLSARDQDRLKIALPGEGSLTVRAAAVESILRCRLEAADTVTRATVTVASRKGGPAVRADLKLSAPGVDPGATQRELEEVARVALVQATGLTPSSVKIAVTVAPAATSPAPSLVAAADAEAPAEPAVAATDEAPAEPVAAALDENPVELVVEIEDAPTPVEPVTLPESAEAPDTEAATEPAAEAAPDGPGVAEAEDGEPATQPQDGE